MPAPAIFLVAAARGLRHLAAGLRRGADRDGRADRGRGADRDPLQRRHGHRLAAVPRLRRARSSRSGCSAPSRPPASSPSFAHYALGFDWILAGIIGAAVAPTDPAVMFSVLGRREVGGRSGTTLEGEAGVNDPAGIALMLGMIELATHDDASFLVVVREFVVEMSVGVVLRRARRARADPAAAPRPAPERKGSTRCSRSCSRARSTARPRSPTARASSPSSSSGSLFGDARTPVQGRDRALLRLAREPRRARRLRRARPDDRSRRAVGPRSGSTGSCSCSCSRCSPGRSSSC